MKKVVLAIVLAIGAICNLRAAGEISIDSLDTVYAQNFDSLGTKATGNTNMPPGWETWQGNPAAIAYKYSNGSVSTAGLYCYGVSTNAGTDLAMGAQYSSGNAAAAWGCKFRNNTGKVLRYMSISYRGETWRRSTSGYYRSLQIYYSLNATNVSTYGTWGLMNSLTYTADTNAPYWKANGEIYYTDLSDVYDLGLGSLGAVQPGGFIWIKFYRSGLPLQNNFIDHGLASDDLQVQFHETDPRIE